MNTFINKTKLHTAASALAIAAMVLSLVPMQAFAANTYSTNVSPSTIGFQDSEVVTFRVTNDSTSGDNIKAFYIAFPVGFTASGITTSDSTFDIGFNSGDNRIESSDSPGGGPTENGLIPGNFADVSATITHTGSTAGDFSWTICAFKNNSFSPGGGAAFDPESCVTETITVEEPPIETGALTINKVITGITGILASSFSYILTANSVANTPASFTDTTAGQGSKTETLNVGTTYSVTESGVSNGQVTVGQNTYNVSTSLTGCSGTISTTPAICTITNAYVQPNPTTGTIVVVKNSAGGDGQFGFASATLGPIVLTTSAGTASQTFTDVLAGVHSITETVPAGWTLNNVVCSDPSSNSTVSLANANASIDLTAGETVTCTFTNVKENTVINGCTVVGALNYEPTATPGNPDAAKCTYPEVTACQTTTELLTTDLSTWNLLSTKIKGHNVLVDGGLRIYTDDASSDAKAAGYYATNFPLSGLGNQTTADALDYTAAFGIEPGLQLVVDFDNNGDDDGILVGEAVYGNAWWLSNSADQFVKDNAPNNGGGYGSLWYGTINEWLTKFPQARVTAIGYSLGSGVYGDGVINSINLGCVEYTFDVPPPVVNGCVDPLATNYNQAATQGNPDAEDCDYNYASICTDRTNLLTNGTFEEPTPAANSFGAGFWEIFASITGWTTTNGVEIWSNMLNATGDNQVVELDTTGNSTITQPVATIAGATYELRFDFAARSDASSEADNSITASADGLSINESTDNTNWTTYGGTFVADGTTNVSFADTGSSNGLGTVIDNAVLCLVNNPNDDDDDDDTELYRIYGYVWHDDNRNQDWDGQDDEEEGNEEDDLEGWTVRITNGETTMTTETDAEGYYYFDVPAGTWTITEEVQSGWLQTTQESYTVTVPEVVEEPPVEESEESLSAMIMNFLVPVAYAQVPTPDLYGPYDFGNDRRGGGGGGGNRAGDRDPEPEVLGDSDSPAPLVLGEQTSAVPTGAPNTGKGGAATLVLGQFLALPRRRN